MGRGKDKKLRVKGTTALAPPPPKLVKGPPTKEERKGRSRPGPPPLEPELDMSLAATVGKQLYHTALHAMTAKDQEVHHWNSPNAKYAVNKEILNWTNKIMKDPRLVRIKGKGENGERMRMTEMLRRRDSLNSGDVFILDTGNMLYIWEGKKSNQDEKDMALHVVKQIILSRGPNTHYTVLKEGKTDDCAAFWKEIRERPLVFGFESAIGPKYTVRKDAGNDTKVEPYKKKLYPIKRKNGSVKAQDRWRAKMNNQYSNQFATRKLESHKVYLLDDGFHLWVWIGKETDITDDEAFKQATDYLQKKNNHWRKPSHNRPASLPIRLVHEDHEPADFKANFKHVRNKRMFRL